MKFKNRGRVRFFEAESEVDVSLFIYGGNNSLEISITSFIEHGA